MVRRKDKKKRVCDGQNSGKAALALKSAFAEHLSLFLKLELNELSQFALLYTLIEFYHLSFPLWKGHPYTNICDFVSLSHCSLRNTSQWQLQVTQRKVRSRR